VVAAVQGTEHRCPEAEIVLQLGRPPKVLPAVGDGVPHDEIFVTVVEEEHAAVAAVEDIGFRLRRGVEDRRSFFDGEEAGEEGAKEISALFDVVEEAEQGWHSVELAVAAGEARIGEEATPGLADEGRADKAPWIFRREAEEDLADEVVHELRRRHLLAAGLDRGE